MDSTQIRFFNKTGYRRLHEADGEIESTNDRPKPNRRWTCGLLVGYILLLLWTLAAAWWQLHNCDRGHEIYSPLQHLVRYEKVRFNQGFWGERTEYMGSPNEKNEAAWAELLRHGMIKLTPEEAAKLPDPTTIYHDENEDYLVGGVEMWHQLHCLNMIRKVLWAEHPTIFYGKDSTVDKEAKHLDHCIDYLRQSLICHGDIGIIGFRYVEQIDDYEPNFNGTRFCRQYDPLREWVDEHRAGEATPDGV